MTNNSSDSGSPGRCPLAISYLLGCILLLTFQFHVASLMETITFPNIFYIFRHCFLTCARLYHCLFVVVVNPCYGCIFLSRFGLSENGVINLTEITCFRSSPATHILFHLNQHTSAWMLLSAIFLFLLLLLDVVTVRSRLSTDLLFFWIYFV